jgi:ankyrin repeat protein
VSGASFNAAAEPGKTRQAFWAAVEAGDPVVVAEMLAEWPDATGWQRDHVTLVGAGPDEFALHIAAKKGHLAIVKMLVAAGADIEAEDYIGQTPLMAALEARQPAIAAFLLEQGADPRHEASGGFTPFFLAARADDTASLQLLLDRGVDIHAVRQGGEDALVFAAAGEARNAIRFLIGKGIDADHRCDDGLTSADMALRMEKPDIAAWIRECTQSHAAAVAAALQAAADAQARDLATCHTGMERTVSVRPPLRLKSPA